MLQGVAQMRHLVWAVCRDPLHGDRASSRGPRRATGADMVAPVVNGRSERDVVQVLAAPTSL